MNNMRFNSRFSEPHLHFSKTMRKGFMRVNGIRGVGTAKICVLERNMSKFHLPILPTRTYGIPL